jgi:gas vesicle protein
MARYEENSRDPESRESQKAEPSEESGGGATRFLLGVGIGVGLALLFAPQSGEETRRWLVETADDRFRQLRRKGRRLVFETQDLLDRSEQSVTRALRTGKNALESVADKLD